MGDFVSFSYLGTVPASKSLLNRMLVCQSYFPDLVIHGASNADDVVLMKKAIQDIRSGVREIECGYAGTVLRFLALRVARLGGEWFLKARPELLQRPQESLFQILGQLSVDWQLESDGLWMHSEGWQLQGDGLHVSMQKSSQFISAVLLNGWNLSKDLFISVHSCSTSQGYLQMTKKLVQSLGMKLIENDHELVICAGANCHQYEVFVEPDMSSTFALSAVAAVNGNATFQNFPEVSLQPDIEFVKVLRAMGVNITRSGSILKVNSTPSLKGLEYDVSTCPDLFPSLATLCCLAKGDSYLYGAPHLKFKESDRIKKVVELVRPLGRVLEHTDDGLKISGSLTSSKNISQWIFDPAHDHRMAMAAAILIKVGYLVKLLHPEVVTKSFPEFWSAIGEVV